MWLTVTYPNSRLLPPPVKYKRLPGLPFRLRGLVVSQLHPSPTHTYIHADRTLFGKSYFSRPTNQCWEVRSTVLSSYSRTKLLRYVPLHCYSDLIIITWMFWHFLRDEGYNKFMLERCLAVRSLIIIIGETALIDPQQSSTAPCLITAPITSTWMLYVCHTVTNAD